MSFAVVNNPLNGRLTGTPPNLTYTPDARYTGTDRFTFKVNDGATDSTPATVTIAINPINRPPVLTVPAAQTVNEGQQLAFTVSANDPNPGQQLTFTATNSPGGASFNQTSNTTARFIWTPSFTQAGSFTVSFRVTDNGVPALSDTKTVTITVNDVNRPPVLTVPGVQTVVAGQNLSFTVSATDPDAGQTATLSAENLPPSASFDPAIGLFSWTPTAPQAGAYTVTFKATDNGVPLLSESKEVKITVDGRWQQTGDIEGGIVYALLQNEGNLLAGTGIKGIHRSTNQAQTWTLSNNGIPAFKITSLAASANTIYAATLEAGIYRSITQGQTWEAVGQFPNLDSQIFRLVLGVSDTTIYAGRVDESGTFNGIYRYTQAEPNWTPINSGLSAVDFRDFAFVGSAVFVATYDRGVFRLDGNSWVTVNNGITGTTQASDLAVSGSSLYVAVNGGGIFRSDDLGQNWTALNTGLANRDLISITVRGNVLYAGTNYVYGGGSGEVYRSDNGGQLWERTGSGLPPYPIYAVVPTENGLFAGTQAGVFTFNNLGRFWSSTNKGMTALGLLALTQSRGNLITGSLGGGIFRSSNGGQSWDRANSGLASDIVGLGASDTSLFAATNAGGVFRSTDQGVNWEQANVGITGTIKSIGVMGPEVYAGSYQGEVFRSLDQGRNWTKTSLHAESAIQSLTVSGSTIYANTFSNGIFRSDDRGLSWRPINTGLGSLNVVTLGVKGNVLLAGTNGAGLFRSENGGQSWTTVSVASVSVVNMILVSGETIFIATNLGVFRSDDGGRTWRSTSAGLPSTFVTDMLVVGDKLYACTIFNAGGGRVYVLPF